MEVSETKAINTATEINSPYFNVAAKLVKESSIPQADQETIVNLLKEIDKQGVENLSLYRSEKFEGVSFPFTKISVNLLASQLRTEEEASDRREIYFIFPGFAYPPHGHPFTPWDITYDRAIGLLPKILRPAKKGEPVPVIDIYVLGSPNSLWGSVSKDWIRKMRSEGFKVYGKLYSEIVDEIAEEDTDRIVLHGMSTGAATALQTSRFVEKGGAVVLLDNPGGLQERREAVLKALQTPLGFIGESAARMTLDPRTKEAIKTEEAFIKSLEERLEVRGISPPGGEQDELKKRSALTDALNLVKGSGDEVRGIRAYIRRGLLDPTSFSPSFILRSLKRASEGKTPAFSKGRTIEFPISSTHFINRYRVGRWARIVDFAKPNKT